MNEEFLTVLVELLQSIDNNLNDISVSLNGLSECISDTQEGGRLCITGDVTDYSVN